MSELQSDEQSSLLRENVNCDSGSVDVQCLRSSRWLRSVEIDRVEHKKPPTGPESDGSNPSSTMGNCVEGRRPPKAGRVQWTPSLDESLFSICHSIGVPLRAQELLRCWREAHPDLPSSSVGALKSRYYRIRKRGENIAAQPSPEGADEPRSASAELSPARPLGQPSQDQRQRDDVQNVEEVGLIVRDPVSDDRINESDGSCGLREEFLTVLRKVEGRDVGDLSVRRRPSCQGIRVEGDLLTKVDLLIAELYERGEKSLWRLNCLVYTGAVVVETRARRSLTKSEHGVRKDKAIKDKEADVLSLRRRVGWLTDEISRRRRSQRLTRRQRSNRARLRRMFGVQNMQQLKVQLETEKARLRVRSLQLRRLRAARKRRALNDRYRRQGPKVLGDGTASQNVRPPAADQISEYWTGVVGVSGSCDLSDAAIAQWKGEMDGLPEPRWEEPASAVWRCALKKMKSWKAPGRDGIQAYWWKVFHQAADILWGIVKGSLEGSDVEIPDWFVKGRTVLIPKKECQGQPDQYRPITCLNTGYKLLTAVITILLRQHVVENDILPAEQKALRPSRRGCLDALWTDAMLTGEARYYKKSLSVAWIDYSKAYDRVPHEWLEEMLDSIKAPPALRRCISNLIPKWHSVFQCGRGRDLVSVDLAFKRGLFQGDSLSPLLFCLCIAPLSSALRRSSDGFYCNSAKGLITHTLFMDDLKAYSKGPAALERMLKLIDRVSKAVGMQLGLTKCAVAHIRKGQDYDGGSAKLPDQRTVLAARAGNPYKYLGIEQVFEPDLAAVRKRLSKLYEKRLRKIWSSDLNSKNKTLSTNVWAVSVFRYYFGILKWRREDVAELDVRTRAVLRSCKSHQYNASKYRPYIPRSEGGRGLTNLEHAWEREQVATAAYLCATEDPQLEAVVRYLSKVAGRGDHSTVIKFANNVFVKYDLDYTVDERGVTDPAGERVTPKHAIRALKIAQTEALKSSLMGVMTHREFFGQCHEEGWDTQASHFWLVDGRLQSKTEGLMIAAQDGAVWTRAFRRRNAKESISEICRVCKEAPETVGHLLSACKPMNFTVHKERHDRVLYQVVRALSKRWGLTMPDSLRWGTEGWNGVACLENSDVKLAIDVSVPTDRELTARRPDLISYSKGDKRIHIFDVAVAWEPLLPEREAEKRGKYQELARDLATQYPGWRTSVHPLVLGSLGSLRGFRSEWVDTGLLGKTDVDRLAKDCQFEVVCSAVRILRQTLSRD